MNMFALIVFRVQVPHLEIPSASICICGDFLPFTMSHHRWLRLWGRIAA